MDLGFSSSVLLDCNICMNEVGDVFSETLRGW